MLHQKMAELVDSVLSFLFSYLIQECKQNVERREGMEITKKLA